MKLAELSREQLEAQLSALLEKENAAEEDKRLLFNLQVHQVELEMQNREVREAQISLEESHRRYAELYEYAPVAYFTLNGAAVILNANRAALTLLGIERNLLVDKPLLALVRMEDSTAFLKYLHQSTKTRGPVQGEFRFSQTPRGAMDVEATTLAMFDGAKNLTGYHTTLTDISQRKRAAEQERRRAHGLQLLDAAGFKLMTALASLPDLSVRSLLLVIADAARELAGAEIAACGYSADPELPLEAWVVSAVNPARATDLGLSAPDADGAGGTGRAVACHEGLVRLKDVRQHPALGGSPPDALPRATFLGVPIRYAGKKTGCLALADKRGADEFTEDNESSVAQLAERAGLAIEIVRLRTELAKAIQSREDLLAVVSHDMRNPLASIGYIADLLRRQDPSGSPEKSRQLDRLSRACTQIRHLIDDLLNAAAIESGGFTMEFGTEAVQSIVSTLIEDLKPGAEEKGLHIDASVPPELPLIQCDRARVAQVLANLISNAIKFTASGGRIGLTVEARGAEVYFAVSDNGPGIPASELSHIFERYRKGRESGRQGMGLGLFIAQGIVQGHGGRIWADSEVGRGTKISFTLPVSRRS